MNLVSIWLANGAFVLLTIFNTIFWGYSIQSVGAFTMSISFLLKLGTNFWFILAMISALAATIFTYYILATIGIAKGRLFLTTGSIAVIITSYFVFHEQFTQKSWIGIILVLIGAVLLS